MIENQKAPDFDPGPLILFSKGVQLIKVLLPCEKHRSFYFLSVDTGYFIILNSVYRCFGFYGYVSLRRFID